MADKHEEATPLLTDPWAFRPSPTRWVQHAQAAQIHHVHRLFKKTPRKKPAATLEQGLKNTHIQGLVLCEVVRLAPFHGLQHAHPLLHSPQLDVPCDSARKRMATMVSMSRTPWSREHGARQLFHRALPQHHSLSAMCANKHAAHDVDKNI